MVVAFAQSSKIGHFQRPGMSCLQELSQSDCIDLDPDLRNQQHSIGRLLDPTATQKVTITERFSGRSTICRLRLLVTDSLPRL